MSVGKGIDWQGLRARLADRQAALEAAQAVDPARLQTVYDERARQLATRRAATAEQNNNWPALVFTLGPERFCLAVSSISEVLPLARCCGVPGASEELFGVINVRGEIRSVLNLARMLKLPEPAEDDRARGYIVLAHHGQLEVGLRVDGVDKIVSIAADELSTSSDDAAALSMQYVRGRTADRVAVLDLEAIFVHEVFASGHQRESEHR